MEQGFRILGFTPGKIFSIPVPCGKGLFSVVLFDVDLSQIVVRWSIIHLWLTSHRQQSEQDKSADD